MNELKQNSENPMEQPVNSGDSSIFFDRHDAPFERWMDDQDLARDASDALVVEAMHRYFEVHNASSITEHRIKQLHR